MAQTFFIIEAGILDSIVLILKRMFVALSGNYIMKRETGNTLIMPTFMRP